MTNRATPNQFATHLTDEVREQLLTQQSECTFIWQGKHEAIGTVMSFVWAEGRVWLTTDDTSPRVTAVRKTGRACVVVSSAGTGLGASRCVSMRGTCSAMDDASTRNWFFPLLCQKLFPNSPRAQAVMLDMMNRPRQVVLCFVPECYSGYDGKALMEKMAGLS